MRIPFTSRNLAARIAPRPSRREALVLTLAAFGFSATHKAFAASDALDLPVFKLKPFSLQPIAGLTGTPAPSLETLTDEVSVLNFWGAWCPACRNEHTMLLKLHDEGLRIVGVNYNDTDEKALRYLEQAGNPFQFVGKDEVKGGLIEMLDVESFPQTFVIGRQADVQWQSTGTLTKLELDDIRQAVDDAKNQKN